ncbi:carbohydrate ABC transporter permease [Nakamurella endophytica]|uniref:carbohydrate ABC transporter permease n=1 Tax=Nakamurella endophytica TaxID=1748367 RepID=UPI0016680A67|nr:sugar ABC transporter permease [Nakamurella endophytica]
MTAGGFLLPNLVLSGVFLVLPLILTVVISFQKLDSLGPAQWLGVNNFLDLFRDPTFYETLWNTVVFTVCTVPLGMAVGLGIALLLNTVMPLRTLWRAVIFVPLVLSSVSVGLLGAWMFDQYNGFVNKFLAVLGIDGPDWQSNGTWAMVSVILMTLWQRIGLDMIIYLAGLQGVDPAVLEAAEVDGASSWRRFRSIVFPLLGPSTFFLLIMNLLFSFQVFDTVYAMTAGGPNFSTTTLVVYAYQQGFSDHGPGQLGYAAAIGVVIFAVSLLLTAGQWRLSTTRDEVG